MWNGLKRIGWFLVLVCFSYSPLLATEYSPSELRELEIILETLQNELLNSKALLQNQKNTLANLRISLGVSERTLRDFEKDMKALTSHIKLLEETVSSLQLELTHSKTLTAQASTSLEEASRLFDNYQRTTKIIMWTGGTVILALLIAISYKILEDKLG